ncbi:glycosyltransferase family 2 protein [Paenibacillus sp. 1P07SE]|uniref:glycosyltransferase family 2 protein n=1 Tax=Paenibacillus sp. 1P07SE TaxID=3132209 RepID=UPI0039A6F47F
MKKPLVSVVIPYFSHVNWLIEALESVEKQDYDNLEVILVNDGSKDNLECLLNEFKINITYLFKENGGPSSARNLGMEKSKGKYIAFLDSDDIWLPNKLSTQISFMEKEGYVWSQHSYIMFWENNDRSKIIDTSIYNGNVFRSCFISFKVQTSCFIVLKSAIDKNKIYFPLNRRYGQDGDFYRKLAERFPLGTINGVFSKFRIRGTNAGFRAKVQLSDKSLTWENIKTNQRVLKMLPFNVKMGYKIASIFSAIINKATNIFRLNEDLVEKISKAFYVIPYLLFKISATRK